MTRLPAPLLGLLLVLGMLAPSSPAGAEDAAPLSVADVLASHRYVRGLPDWRWRPGHAQLVRRSVANGRTELLALDPATGRTSTLLDLRSLEPLVDRKPMRLRRIGRSAAARHVWATSGRALVALVKGDLVWVDLETGTRRRLTRTTSPLGDVRVAPDGSLVSFSRDHDLWVVPTAGGEPRRLTTGGSEEIRNASLDWVYPEELSLHQAAWFSPDARRVAYLQLDERPVRRHPLVRHMAPGTPVQHVRYPRVGGANPVARVGVVGARGGATTWLDLGTPRPEYVARVAWLPDGRHVGVVTLDRLQQRLRLLACPIDGGAPVLLLEETDAAWIDAPPAPHFVDARRFLWRSDRDGARRWYLASLPLERSGAVTLQPLTPPGVDVRERPSIDGLEARLYYTGERHGARRTQLLAGTRGRPAPFASDGHAGSERALVDPTGNWAVVTTSGVLAPPRREVRRVADGKVLQRLGEAATDALARLALAVPEVGRIETDSGPVAYRLWKPSSGFDESQPHPLIVRVYAGPDTRLVHAGWDRTIFLTSLFTQRGYVVLEVDGRGSRGLGAKHARRVHGQLGVRELEDQARAVREIAKRPYVDGDRVGITGWSFGGTMTCLALTLRGDVFKVGVAIAPVTDWRLYDTIYTERYLGTTRTDDAVFEDTSAVHHARTMNGHLLLLHGAIDDNVHVENTYRLVKALLSAGKKKFEWRIYPGCGHGLGSAQRDAYERMLRYFEDHL